MVSTNNLEYLHFQKRVLQLTGIDLGAYNPHQLERRIRTMLERTNAKTYSEYLKTIEQDHDQLERFYDFLTINVSEFFRNPEKFEELEKVIIPMLLQRTPSLRVWSAGCSGGAEPYSVAMILEDMHSLHEHKILGTDIDRTALKKAQKGIYAESEVRNVSPSRLKGYFRLTEDGYQVTERIRKRVEFRIHNLLGDDFDGGWDLIFCRNVVIYFTDKAKDRLYRSLHRALKDGGVLFVGGTEIILNAKEQGFEPISTFFYRKRVS